MEHDCSRNILVISRSLPWPLDRGERIRLNVYFKAFLSAGYKITWVVIYTENDPESLRYMREEYPRCKFEFFKTTIGNTNFIPRMIYPNIINNMYDSVVQAQLDDIIKSNKYDVLFYKGLQYTRYIEKYMVNNNKIVFDMDDIESLKYLRYIRTLKFGFGRYYLTCLIEYLKLSYYETMIIPRLNTVIVASVKDEVLLSESKKYRNIKTIQNAIEIPDVTYEEVGNNSILYIGSFGYDPNVDGAQYFLEKIYPIILKEIPDAQLHIAGPLSREKFKKYDDSKSIFVLGFVDDLRALYRNTKIVVVPLRIGGGTRLKILEAASYYKPVISTSIGCEGLDFINNESIVIADCPEEIALKCCELLKNASKRKYIGDNARMFVVKEYGIKKTENEIIQLMETI